MLLTAILSSLILFVYALFHFTVKQSETRTSGVELSAVDNKDASVDVIDRFSDTETKLHIDSSSKEDIQHAAVDKTHQLQISDIYQAAKPAIHTHLDVDSQSLVTLPPVFKDADHHHG